MGSVLRIAGALWVGVGVVNICMLANGDSGVSTLMLLSHMVFYGIPGLLLLLIGVVLHRKR